ncbi:hypothetical protein F8388_021573, partial [Cannabis sativa]
MWSLFCITLIAFSLLLMVLVHENVLAKSKPLGRLVPTKPPHTITQKGLSDIFGACVGFAYATDNEHERVVELAEKLTRASDIKANVTELETDIGKLKTGVSDLQGT